MQPGLTVGAAPGPVTCVNPGHPFLYSSVDNRDRGMHVLYLHQYFVPPDGVGGTRSYEVARRLVARGHSVTLITSTALFPPSYSFKNCVTELKIAGIDVLAIRVPYSNTLSPSQRIRAFLSFALRATALAIRQRGVDVVFATSTPLTIAIPGIAARMFVRRPMVFEVRDLWPDIPIALGYLRNPLLITAARWLERAAYRHSARVVALSPGFRDGVARTGYPRERIEVIPNGCDLEAFQVSSTDVETFLELHPQLRGGRLVVYAGTLGYVNGLTYLVDIARETLASNPEVRFVVAGSGAQEERVRDRARRCGVLGRNLFLLPPLPKRQVPKLLGAATIATSFVINSPALWDNSANKFFDGLAAGKPLLVNHEGWQADLLRRSGAGLVVPPDNAAEAARLLVAFLADDTRLINSGKAALALARREFSRDLLTDRLIKLLEEVTAAVSNSNLK